MPRWPCVRLARSASARGSLGERFDELDDVSVWVADESRPGTGRGLVRRLFYDPEVLYLLERLVDVRDADGEVVPRVAVVARGLTLCVGELYLDAVVGGDVAVDRLAVRRLELSGLLEPELFDVPLNGGLGVRDVQTGVEYVHGRWPAAGDR